MGNECDISEKYHIRQRSWRNYNVRVCQRPWLNSENANYDIGRPKRYN